MPIVTLTSDFGEDDYLAGAVKGVLYKSVPDVQLVDITHRLLPFNDHKAAHVIRNAVMHYPPGTFHVVLVNLFQYLPSHLLLIKHKGQYFLLADNGLIMMILEEPPEQVVALPLPMNEHVQRNVIHIVDVFSSAIRELVTGKTIMEAGVQIDTIKGRNVLKPVMTDQYIDGQILYIDAFENVVINISRPLFEEQRKGRGFKIIFKRDEYIDRISETYADVPPGDKLALFNASGYLEIAVNRGNAAGLFGLQGFTEGSNSKYAQARISYQSVRILFDS
jgi:S-adenosylmethionine hydrolase